MDEKQKKALGKQLKIARVLLNMRAKDVAIDTGISLKQLRNIEANGTTGAVAKYLFYLRKNGADLNKLFDEI